MRFKIGLLVAFIASSALAFTAADKAALQAQVNAIKSTVDSLVVDAPPVVAWPRIAPDVLDIDLVDQNSVLKAKLLDGAPGPIGDGSAIHYGQMAGDLTYVNGVADYSQKFSNPSCPPRWGVEANGLHYLESCTDMTFAFAPGVTGNRLINWNFGPFLPHAELYARYMVRYDKVILLGQGNIGVKGSGIGGSGAIHVFEIGPVANGMWQAQDYFYDAEVQQGVQRFNFWLVPDRWYTIEQHMKMNTATNGVANRDGVVEWKIDGVIVQSRTNVLLNPYGVGVFDGYQMQFFDGGMLPVKSVVPPPSLRARHARIAVSTKGWIGPPKEWP